MQFSFSLQMKLLTESYSELLSEDLKKALEEFMEWQQLLKENSKEKRSVNDQLMSYCAAAKRLADKYEIFRADVQDREEQLEGYIIIFNELILPILTKVMQNIECFCHDVQKDIEAEKFLDRFVFEINEE